MANLVFPQLSSGAMVQYPVTRTREKRTVKNVMAGGDLICYPDGGAGQLVWSLEYTELSNVDLALLQAHFAACNGPYRAFTFLDPIGNLLAWSGDLTQPIWGAPASLVAAGGISDPDGGTAAFSLTNNGQVAQGLSQSLAIPAAFQYVFSVYVQSTAGATVTLTRSGEVASVSQTFTAGITWQRIAIAGTLADAGGSLSVGVSMGPGQQLNLYAPQLEPQVAASRARLTGKQGGVYANAHWGVNSLPVVATAPGLFSTSFTIEAAL
jgi:hypothetical protein